MNEFDIGCRGNRPKRRAPGFLGTAGPAVRRNAGRWMKRAEKEGRAADVHL